jgi:hypothetical protein
MEITVFEIVSSEMLNPNDHTISMITAVVCLALTMGGVVLAFETKSNPDLKPAARFGILFAFLITAACSLLFGKYLSTIYTPQNYESHAECRYILKNEKEQIEHFTLIPREPRVFCNKPGTMVTRVKSHEYTKFFLEFEVPR